MRTIRFLIQKEFIQIFRNKGMLPIIFGMPIIQLLILTNAATFDLRNVQFHLIDRDQTTTSRKLVEKFTSSEYFIPVAQSFSDEKGEENLKSNRARMVLNIPGNFEKEVLSNKVSHIQFIINAEDGNAAGLTQTYASNIVHAFAMEYQSVWSSVDNPKQIKIDYSFWYNPELNYETYMIPGILVALVSMIGLFLSGMNIVREKEIGTIEQLNVTPIKKHEFIIGKLLPFWLLGLFILGFGLFVAKLIFNIPIMGSLWLIFGTAAVYLIVVLGIGLFISTVTDTQQQAMFIAWFFMVIFMLLGGLFTPIESMPSWAQNLTVVNPIAHYIQMMRGILIKGAVIGDISFQVIVLSLYSIIMLTLSVLRYRKVND
ncbi:ABC transporter permease [bacterium]|nr:ABC transporter permease [bacterium]